MKSKHTSSSPYDAHVAARKLRNRDADLWQQDVERIADKLEDCATIVVLDDELLELNRMRFHR